MFPKWINIKVCHFLIHLLKMTDSKIYPPIPSAPSIGAQGPPPENPQIAYHLNVVQAKRRGLIAKEKTFKKKYNKYIKTLNRLTRLNVCSSGISIATGISSVATFATFIGIPVSTALGAASMTGAIASGIISALAKSTSRNLRK